MAWREPEEYIEFVEGRSYTPKELDQIATQMLRENSNEIIHTCDGKEPECDCKRRGLKGENPILFESHLLQRKKREIMVSTGTPDPSIVAGLYFRCHPEGRPMNSPEARKRSGLSFYR